MKNTKYFRVIPAEVQLQQALLKTIVDDKLLPEPEEIDGLTFVGREILFTDQPNRKNKKGETINFTRTAGTGSRDQTLVGSFQRGIDIREMPPKVLRTILGDDLFGGFGRHEVFEILGYLVWIYDVYRESTQTRNYLQAELNDVKEDAAISDNGGFKSKPATKEDYVRILTKRIQSQKWTTDTCKQWFKTIDHCLSNKQINEYISTAQLKEKADGVIEDIPQKTAASLVKNHDPKLGLLNVTDAERDNLQRLLRCLPAIMNGYINSKGRTQEFAAFHTSTPSHESIDKSIIGGQKIIKDLLDLIDDFQAARNFYKTDACRLTKVVYQKINAKHKVKSIIDLSDYDWESDK